MSKITELKVQLHAIDTSDETTEDMQAKRQHDINYMVSTDMAVVVLFRAERRC